MSRPANQMGLAEALRALQSNQHHRDEVMAVVWPAILTQTRLQRCRDHADDVAQLTAFKLLRTTSRFSGSSDAQAGAYLAKVVRNLLLDQLRKQRQQQAGRVRQFGEDDRDLLDDIPNTELGDDPWPARAQLLAVLLDHLRGEIDEQISRSGLSLIRRELRWKQANAAFLKALQNKSAQQIAEAVDSPSATSAAIHKWVERGRPFVLEALAALGQGANSEEATVLQGLHAKLAERRADAGKPRPARRRTAQPAAPAQRRSTKPPAKRKSTKPPPKGKPKKPRPTALNVRMRRLVSRERDWASVQIRWMKPGEARVVTRRAMRMRRLP